MKIYNRLCDAKMTPIALVCFVLFFKLQEQPNKTEQPVTTSQELAGQMPNKDSSKTQFIILLKSILKM